MPGTGGPAVEISLLGGAAGFFATGSARRISAPGSEGFEDGIEMGDDLTRAADHLAVSAVESPDAAARAHVHVMNSVLLELPGAADVVNVIGIPAVDQDIAALQFGRELLDGGIHPARRHHHPDGARRGQLLDQFFERSGSCASFVRYFPDVFRMPIEGDALMFGPQQAAAHVAAHSTKADHSDLHVGCSSRELPDGSLYTN